MRTLTSFDPTSVCIAIFIGYNLLIMATNLSPGFLFCSMVLSWCMRLLCHHFSSADSWQSTSGVGLDYTELNSHPPPGLVYVCWSWRTLLQLLSTQSKGTCSSSPKSIGWGVTPVGSLTADPSHHDRQELLIPVCLILSYRGSQHSLNCLVQELSVPIALRVK